jgi:hypothetical protein
LLFADDCFQHVSRLGDVGKIDFGLDALAVALAAGARRFPPIVSCGASMEMGANLLGFVVLERAGVRFLLGNADLLQYIEDCLAFNFQLSG